MASAAGGTGLRTQKKEGVRVRKGDFPLDQYAWFVGKSAVVGDHVAIGAEVGLTSGVVGWEELSSTERRARKERNG